jgi:hypothetical protein
MLSREEYDANKGGVLHDLIFRTLAHSDIISRWSVAGNKVVGFFSYMNDGVSITSIKAM